MNGDNDPLPYTLAGRLILIASILTPVFGMWGAIYATSESLPSGSYPLLFFIMPFVLPAFIVFFGGCTICRRMGVRVRKDDVVNDRGIPEPAKTIATESSKAKKQGYCKTCKTEVELDNEARCPICGWPI